MIPRLIHQWWSGPPMPDAFQKLSKAIETMHPGWEIHRWSPETIGPLRAQRHYDEAARYVAPHRVEVYRSNLVRYELLWTFGGIYVDVDLAPVRPLPDVDDLWITSNPSNPDPAAIGARPRHPFIAELTLEAMRAGPSTVRSCPGCEHLNAVLARFPEVEVVPLEGFLTGP